jgi:dienelactone hydrolase
MTRGTEIRALLLTAICLAISSAEVSGATESALTVTPVGSSLEIPATLIRPEGAGPFPALVIMHDCSGLGARSSGAPARWAAELVRQGYVILIPDSFAPRGFPEGVCVIPGKQRERLCARRGCLRRARGAARAAVRRRQTRRRHG